MDALLKTVLESIKDQGSAYVNKSSNREAIKNAIDIVKGEQFEADLKSMYQDYSKHGGTADDSLLPRCKKYFYFYLLQAYLHCMLNSLGSVNFNQDTPDDESVDKLKSIFKELADVTKYDFGNDKSGVWSPEVISSCFSDMEGILDEFLKKKKPVNSTATVADRREAYATEISEWFKAYGPELYRRMMNNENLCIDSSSNLTKAEHERLDKDIDEFGVAVWRPKAENPTATVLKKLNSYLAYEALRTAQISPNDIAKEIKKDDNIETVMNSEDVTGGEPNNESKEDEKDKDKPKGDDSEKPEEQNNPENETKQDAGL